MRPQRLLSVFLLSLFLVGAPFAGSAFAATKTWKATPISNSVGSSFNWVGDAAPQDGDDLVFTGTSTFMILAWDTAIVPNSITFQSGGWLIGGAINASVVPGAGGIRCTAGGGITNQFSVHVQTVSTQLNIDAVSGCTLQFNDSLLGTANGMSIGEFGGTGTVKFVVTNSVSGKIRVRNGLLDCGQNSGCLRNSIETEETGTIVESGAALRVNATISDEHLTLNGGNGQGSGALYTDTGATWFGPMVLNADTSIGGAGNIGLSDGISGAGGLTKIGSGTVNMSIATSTYTGPTVVSAGRLNMNGATPTSSTTVQSGATLGGIGSIPSGAVVNSGGTLAPGSSPGIFNTGNLTLSSGSTLSAEINGTTPGSGYDQVNVTGTVALGGSTLAVTMGFVPAPGDTFTIIANDGVDAVSGIFAGLAEGATLIVGGTTFVISYVGGTGNDVVLTVLTAVPTFPSLFITSLVGALLLAVSAWQLRRRPSPVARPF